MCGNDSYSYIYKLECLKKLHLVLKLCDISQASMTSSLENLNVLTYETQMLIQLRCCCPQIVNYLRGFTLLSVVVLSGERLQINRIVTKDLMIFSLKKCESSIVFAYL